MDSIETSEALIRIWQKCALLFDGLNRRNACVMRLLRKIGCEGKASRRCEVMNDLILPQYVIGLTETPPSQKVLNRAAFRRISAPLSDIDGLGDRAPATFARRIYE
jgi:hypothetical protein